MTNLLSANNLDVDDLFDHVFRPLSVAIFGALLSHKEEMRRNFLRFLSLCYFSSRFYLFFLLPSPAPKGSLPSPANKTEQSIGMQRVDGLNSCFPSRLVEAFSVAFAAVASISICLLDHKRIWEKYKFDCGLV
jgi:hypothetical protein